MKRSTTFLSTALLASMVSALVACGGGGGGGDSSSSSSTGSTSSSSSAAASSSSSSSAGTIAAGASDGTSSLQTGVYLDSRVAGLRYVTATQSGYTDANGQYQFMPGETVQFYLYGTALNNTKASLVLTPADATDADLDYTVNLLRFLQTVDTDNDASNGITLPTVDASDASYVINFNQDIYAFEQDASVLAFLTKYASGRSLVSVNDAVTHFNASIEATDSTVILDLTGKHLVGVTTDNLCSNSSTVYQTLNYDVTASGFRETYPTTLSWTSSSVTSSTALGSVACYSKTDVVDQTLTFASITNTQNTFYGGPTYTYQKMNRIGIRSKSITPSNGLNAVVLIWHTPGTSTITYLRHYIKTTGAITSEPYHTLKTIYTITGDSSSSSASSTSSASSSTSSTASSSSSASSTASSSSSASSAG
jgi:hypothetical protein